MGQTSSAPTRPPHKLVRQAAMARTNPGAALASGAVRDRYDYVEPREHPVFANMPSAPPAHTTVWMPEQESTGFTTHPYIYTRGVVTGRMNNEVRVTTDPCAYAHNAQDDLQKLMCDGLIGDADTRTFQGVTALVPAVPLTNWQMKQYIAQLNGHTRMS